jgi:predicted nucleic acid-binding protein
MTIIIDANILISGIIKPYGQITKLIYFKRPEIDFVIPEYALEEIARHKVRICKETKTTSLQFEQIFDALLVNILRFSTDSISQSDIQAAEKLVLSIDTKDIWYVAFAISLDALLWTGDLKLYRGLRRKDFNQIIITKEMEDIIKGL